MDSLHVDMELLRRIGEIRKAVEELDGDSPSPLHTFRNRIDSVKERCDREAGGLVKLLDLMASVVVEAEGPELTPTSRLANGILAAVNAAEHAFFSQGSAEEETLLDQAGSTVLLAAGRDPGEWHEWTPAGGEDVPVEGSPEVLASPEADGEDHASEAAVGPTLDEIAGFMVRMDPEDRGQTRALHDLVIRWGETEDLPDSIREIQMEINAALEEVTAPPRVRKTLRREVVEGVGELMEAASLLAEEEELGDVLSARSEEAPARTPEVTDGEEADEEGPLAGPEASADETEDDFEAPAMEIFPESEPLPEGTDPDLVLDFVTEGFEYLEQAEEALLTLERDPDDKEAVNVVFRAFHTIKGVSGFLELRRISDLAHHAETLLSRVREEQVRYTGVVADLSLRSIDILKALLESVREGVGEGTIRLTPGFGPLFTVLSDPNLPDRIEAGTVQTAQPGGGVERVEDGEEVDEPEAAQGEGETPGANRTTTAEGSVRVRTDRLDRLVDMVGELVIAHSMLAQDPTILIDRGNLSRKVDHSAKILRELQDLSTSLRMVPLKPAFRKVSRVVRDLSKKVGKPVDLITEGEDTEIDRTMVDILADPLVHMVRNSLDHGLESPDDRRAAGKPPRGRLQISAFQAGGSVVIEVRDDGRGLDRERILAKAMERGVVDSDRGLSDREVYNLIFAPGFSTAEKVTEVSGRGVGMDVVRRNVESLRGRVSIESEPGEGSTFSIHLPLTLAITDGMVIRVGTQRYIIPSVKIHMSLRPEGEALSTVSGRGEMVLIQGELLPVIRLHRLWGISNAVEDPKEGLLVIVGEGDTRSALLVDELVTQQQFVVKPLSGVVANTQGVAGGAIMGDGDVGLILDPEGIIAMARGLAHTAAA